MNPQALNKKIELIQWLSALEDNSIIEKLLKFRIEETKDWWDTISKEEKESIEIGISEANEGNIEPHSSVRKIYEEWL
jgi:CTP:phosphocholine cytidylyltransferase-like protein